VGGVRAVGPRLFVLLAAVAWCASCGKVDVYGVHMGPKEGVPYHYYNACDVAAEPERDEATWPIFKAFVEAELIKFGEPCVVECHMRDPACQQCR
jgi:hypothetical protein